VTVSSYSDSAADVVTLNAAMSQQNDGMAYASDIALKPRPRT
jgi:hypothetical protein